MSETWDQGDLEPPPEVTVLVDYTAPDADEFHPDSPRWGRTVLDATKWKGYKNGDKVYLGWTELVRRWGPLQRPEDLDG